MNETPNWLLPLLAAGQAQKEVTHNEALLAIDRLLHPAVLSRALSVPPADAVSGDSYIIGDAPTGAWAGHGAALARCDGSGWLVTQPRKGCLAWIVDEGQFVVFGGDGWSVGGWPVTSLRIGDRSLFAAPPAEIGVPDGGATVDHECRAVVSALIVALGAQGVIKSAAVG